MPPNKPTSYQIFKTPHGWRLVRQGSQRASAVRATKEEILRVARRLARRQGVDIVVVHDESGEAVLQIRTGRRPGNKSAKPVVASAVARRVEGGGFVHDLMPPPTKPKKR